MKVIFLVIFTNGFDEQTLRGLDPLEYFGDLI